MRKAFICKQIRTKPDYAEPLRWSCLLLKMPPKILKVMKRQMKRHRTEPLLKKVGGGDKDKTQHACIWTMRSSQPAYAATFRGEKKDKNGGEMPL